jgi:DNA-directed RNA polymerase specialized sigma24 family protein
MDENAHSSDDALLRRFKGGDDSAIEVLYQRYAVSFYKLTRAKGFKHEDADDIVQASFLKIVSGITNYDENRGSGTAWVWSVYGSARSDWMRKRQRTLETELLELHVEHLLDQASDPGNEVEDPSGCFVSPLSQVIAQAWIAISPSDRDALRRGRGPGVGRKAWREATKRFRQAIDLAWANTSDEDWNHDWNKNQRSRESAFTQNSLLKDIYEFSDHLIYALSNAWEQISPARQQELQQAGEQETAQDVRISAFQRFWVLFRLFL